MFVVGDVLWNREVKNHDSVNRGFILYVTSCLSLYSNHFKLNLGFFTIFLGNKFLINEY